MPTETPQGAPPAWLSAAVPPPGPLRPADDRTTAAAALAAIRGGATLAYRGDYRNARQLLAAMGRRLEAPRPAGRGRAPRPAAPQLLAAFQAERRQRREAHRLLSRLAVPLVDGPLGVGPQAAGPRVDLHHAPEVAEAVLEALGPAPVLPGLLPLRELLGMIGAHEWRVKGVEVRALGARLHPRYGVFAPVRGEHVELLAEAARRWPPAGKRALDVGTGSGVLAFVLARAGARVTATDLNRAALESTREDAARLRLAGAIEPVEADLFAEGRFDLVVCNPPWLPAEAVTSLERAVYDPGGAFLARLLAGLPAHLAPGGEAWLILSDLAERLGLRRPGELEGLLAANGLRVLEALAARPSHPRTLDQADPLHAARTAEVTSLYRLAVI